MSLSDEDRRILAAVAMNLTKVIWSGSRRIRSSAFYISDQDVTNAVKRLMRKHYVMYTPGKLQTTNRGIIK